MRLNDKADSKTSSIVSKIYCQIFPTQCSVLKYYFLKTTCLLRFKHVYSLHIVKSTLVQALHLMIYCNTTKNILSAISKRQSWKISLDFLEKSIVQIDELFGNKLLMYYVFSIISNKCMSKHINRLHCGYLWVIVYK